tara:strand:+ start:892 stop:1260 length:369 start_codon:yes stop_codon:yes gene_type:complete
LVVVKFITIAYIAFFFFAGINHFINPSFYDSIVPDYIPFPRITHYFVGLIEIFIPFLLLTRFKNITAIFMIFFIVVLYLGNFHIWINDLPYGNNYFSNIQHFIRFLLQLVLIYVTYIIYKYG